LSLSILQKLAPAVNPLLKISFLQSQRLKNHWVYLS